MAIIPKLGALVLVGALAGCSLSSSPGPASSTATSIPSARAGLGAASPAVRLVDEANFQSPSRNISCTMTASLVRCDIVRKNWVASAKPSSCSLDWGNGMYLNKTKAGFVCAGDTVVGTATTVLPYGSSLRAGDLQCDSGNAALRCIDQKNEHGFTLAVADYNLF
jgi:hypothetical protein